jgi:hypothetical protein
MIRIQPMKPKLTLFRRNGIYYSQDSTTGRKLIEATNEAHRSPVPNLQLARACFPASDHAFLTRTWQTVMHQMQTRGRDSSRQRCASVFRTPTFDSIRHKPLLETATADFIG